MSPGLCIRYTVVLCLAHSSIEKEACVAELNRLREMDKERSQKHDQKMKGWQDRSWLTRLLTTLPFIGFLKKGQLSLAKED